MKTALVVGVGAESGLGSALCKRFARGGLHVFAAGRTAVRLDALVGGIRASRATATAVPTDTTQEADVLRLFDAAEREAREPAEGVLSHAGNHGLLGVRKTAT